jgi:hypothetical protein
MHHLLRRGSAGVDASTDGSELGTGHGGGTVSRTTTTSAKLRLVRSTGIFRKVVLDDLDEFLPLAVRGNGRER